MDKIEFRVNRVPVNDFAKRSDGKMDVIDIYVNDKNLIEVLRPIELPQAMKDQPTGDSIAGQYLGHPYEGSWFLKREKIAKPYFLGQTDFSYKREAEENDRSWTPLFTCSGCLEDGCWSLLAAIELDEHLVRWTALRHNHRSHWDYSALGNKGTFTFDRAQYEAALDVIA